MEFQNNTKLKDVMKLVFKDEDFTHTLIIIFLIIVLILSENWTNFIIFLFPLISFGFMIYFDTIRILNKEMYSKSFLRLQPLGDYTNISRRFKFCLYLQSILILFTGAESLYHPQLIDNHFIFYIISIGLIFLFNSYYPFYDLAFYSKIELLIDLFFNNRNDFEIINSELKDNEKNELLNNKNNKIIQDSHKNIILSRLKIKDFIFIHKIITINFLIMMILWILFSFISYNYSIFYFSIELPGSHLLEGQPLKITLFIVVIIIEIPILIIFIIKQIFRYLKNINLKELKELIIKLSKPQKMVLENLIRIYLGEISYRTYKYGQKYPQYGEGNNF